MDVGKETVYIVDDDDAVRDSIRELTESVGLNAETYESAQAFLESFRPKEHACLVLDVRMAGMSGLDLQEELTAKDIDIPVIVITGHGDIPMVVTALQAGAVDFIEKPYREQHLLDSISKALSKNRGKSTAKESLSQRLKDLTGRELEIYEMLTRGHSSKTIARDLDISPRTVEKHRQNLLLKLGFASVRDLMLGQAALVGDE